MTCDRPKDYMAVFDSCSLEKKKYFTQFILIGVSVRLSNSTFSVTVVVCFFFFYESKGDLLTVLVCVCSSPVDCFLTFGFTFSLLDQSHVSFILFRSRFSCMQINIICGHNQSFGFRFFFFSSLSSFASIFRVFVFDFCLNF